MTDRDLNKLRERVSRYAARYAARTLSPTSRAQERYRDAALVQAAVDRVTRQVIDAAVGRPS